MRKIYGLDFETFSEVNLPERGADNYRNDPSFQPILASLAYPDGTVDRYGLLTGRDWIDLKIALTMIVANGGVIAAHNVGFERGVLEWLDWVKPEALVDSAVMARLLGAGSKLEVASRQLTGSAKLAVGSDLMGLFCWPNGDYTHPDADYIQEHLAEEWEQFSEYCDVDAIGSREIVEYGMVLLEALGAPDLWERECELELLTWQQNRAGWHVDMESLTWMKNRGWANSEIAKAAFIQEVGTDLNFRSPAQLKKFAADRGVRYSSLDKYHAPMVLEEVAERHRVETDPEKKQQLFEVLTMLEIKLEIGGATLTKIPTIQNNVDHNNILRDTYVHIGAGQTFRTTSMKVQMQNLSKLDKNLRDLATLSDYSVEWTNTDMAGQFRQVFTATDPEGELIVGDFSAVESRGLAFLAGEDWKLEAYENKMDIYTVLVTKYNNIPYEEVTDEMRPKGKYTELSCGYQASGTAVKDLMLKYGFHISVEEAGEWVTDWREANPNIKQLWYTLDNVLKAAVASNTVQATKLAHGLSIKITPFTVPSVLEVHPSAVSLCIQLFYQGKPYVTRFVHGCYLQGNGIAYYKPAEYYRMDAPLWSNVNVTATQKANKGKKSTDKKVTVLNSIYGGKLTGILVQSFCRELFFDSLVEFDKLLTVNEVKNAWVTGQFHDEIVVNWKPGAYELEEVMELLDTAMSTTRIEGFPLVGDIKHAYRYIK